MRELTFAVPGGLDLPTGGATYDRKTIAALRTAGWRVDVLNWPRSFPSPSDADRQFVAASLAALPDGTLVVIDGLALGTLPGLAQAQYERLRLVALVHHPLAVETGLPLATAARFAAEEREALRWVRAVIVTSRATAATLTADFGVPTDRITVATPGIDHRAAPALPRSSGVPRILSLGQVTPRKAYHVLVAALASMPDLEFVATIAGNLASDPATTDALGEQIARAGLSDRVTLAGLVSDEGSARLHAEADIFAFPSLYEGYGMALAEAMAWRLPIVATTGGAIPEVVPPTAGLLVTPGDAAAFATALRTLICDAAVRASLANGAWAAAARLGGWDATARTIAATLAQL
ncbi:MAG: glycosyl transferase [Novosphingobium sp.]|nr:glycosyl transferase [Novosphingobium sp.]